jgi:hypothetical protein
MTTITPWPLHLAARKRQRARDALEAARDWHRQAEDARDRTARRILRAQARRCRLIALSLRWEAAQLDPPRPGRVFRPLRCPVCLGAREARRRLCAACGETHGWCAGCRTYHPIADFPPATPSARAMGSRHLPRCYAAERDYNRLRVGYAACPRCGGEREGCRRLCPACQSTHGVCRDCGVQPLTAFSKAAPTQAARGSLHAPRCKACHARYIREIKRRRRERGVQP